MFKPGVNHEGGKMVVQYLKLGNLVKWEENVNPNLISYAKMSFMGLNSYLFGENEIIKKCL